ncbi:unnamed protein product [Staurois parvus]|uniref:Uncharacterized protein n=1 Tax=Staurois parvus TaxID=386267 RepID=A0ABN9GVX3_9NEOB|nr:unnamed protein product [Staurois parvus]
MYVKWFDTGMLYYVILVYLVNVTFTTFTFPASSVPRTSLAGNGIRKTDAGISGRHYRGHCRGGHRGSAGQGKRRTDP